MLLVQEMSRHCIIVPLLLQLSSLLWCHVTCFQCYKCNSLDTPSCQLAGNINDWNTCHDDSMCITAVGRTRIFGNSIVEQRLCSNIYSPYITVDRQWKHTKYETTK